VISGSIRIPNEEDALSVKLSMSATEITLRTDGADLGEWPSTAVDIRPIDSTSFEFIAEGDRLIFMPDDPVAFGDSPLVIGPADENRRRKSGKTKNNSDVAGPVSAKEQASSEREHRPRRRKAAKESSEEKPSKPSRRERKATAAAARAEAVPVPPSSGSGSDEDTQDGELPVVHEEPALSPRPQAPEESEFNDTPRTGPKERLNRAWLRSLDTARRYDLFGLDRVPIDEESRGQEHQHTWDHRVAVESGAGNRICTICGKIRR
jgi:hypothetical protein